MYHMEMQQDIQHLSDTYFELYHELLRIAKELEEDLRNAFSDVKHIDRINCRIKEKESFIQKASKLTKEKALKYKNPFKEIQDFIGCRVVVYFKSDIELATEIIKRFYKTIEKQHLVPDDVMKFGYEGTHLICSIPNTMYSTGLKHLSFPDFFELQIKTLYQHAWSQSNHGLGYKPGNILSYEEERKLAFVSAQSWGADRMLLDILEHKNT